MSPRLRAALIAGAIAATAFTVLAPYYGGWPGPPAPPIFVITQTVVLLAYLLVGLAAWQFRPAERIGLLFTVTGYAWMLGWLTDLHAALPFTIGYICNTLYQPFLAHLALAWPYGRLRSRFDRALVAANYAWNIGSNIVVTLFWNPRFTGCGSGCPANLLMLPGSTQLNGAGNLIVTVVSTCLTVTIVARIARHWMSARGYARRALTWMIWFSLPVAVYLELLEIVSDYDTGLSGVVVYGVCPLILAAGPIAYGVRMLLTRNAAGALGATLVNLEPGPDPDLLRDALAKALSDPSLRLAFRAADGDGYLDTHGLPAGPPPAGRMHTPLGPAGDAILIHDAELRHEPELVRAAAAAARLALEHARLQAEVRDQLEQVRASRARIVEAGDTARRRIERDLHDGAQQRLVTLSLALAMARRQAEGVSPALQELLESASKEAGEAIAELRELARGIHPAVLTESGLAGAIQSLAERSPVPVVIGAVPAGRFSAPVEATAYFVVSEALANVAKHAPRATARVTISQRTEQLVVEVSDDGPGGARPEAGSGLRGLADRVASVGGTLRVEDAADRGTRIEAAIPCR